MVIENTVISNVPFFNKRKRMRKLYMFLPGELKDAVNALFLCVLKNNFSLLNQ